MIIVNQDLALHVIYIIIFFIMLPECYLNVSDFYRHTKHEHFNFATYSHKCTINAPNVTPPCRNSLPRKTRAFFQYTHWHLYNNTPLQKNDVSMLLKSFDPERLPCIFGPPTTPFPWKQKKQKFFPNKILEAKLKFRHLLDNYRILHGTCLYNMCSSLKS